MWVNFSFVRTRQCRQAIKLDKLANEDGVSNGIFYPRSKKELVPLKVKQVKQRTYFMNEEKF